MVLQIGHISRSLTRLRRGLCGAGRGDGIQVERRSLPGRPAPNPGKPNKSSGLWGSSDACFVSFQPIAHSVKETTLTNSLADIE